MNKITFKISLLFAPLAYVFHHCEESIIFNFRAWRSLYFPDNKLPSTELMLVILMAISLVYIILHFIVQCTVGNYILNDNSSEQYDFSYRRNYCVSRLQSGFNYGHLILHSCKHYHCAKGASGGVDI